MMASIGLQVCKNQVQHRELFMEQVLTQLSLKTGMLSWEIEKAKVPRGYGKCIDYGGGLPGQADPKHGTGQE